MLPVERQFPQFALEVLSGLYKAALSDTNVFLLTLAGGLLGSNRRRLRGAGQSLGLYLIFRRLDAYVDAGVQIARLAAITKKAHEHRTTQA